MTSSGPHIQTSARPLSRGAVVAWAALSLGGLGSSSLGCHGQRDAEERLGLPAEVARPAVDPAKVTDVDGLLAALRMSPDDRDRALGATRRLVHTVTRLTPEGGSEEALDETVRLDSDGKGALHLVRDYTRGRGEPVASAASPGGSSGMEAILVGGPPPERLSVRPRFGSFVTRRPEPGEPERLRRLGDETLAATLSLVAHGARLEDRGSRPVDGRDVRTLALTREASPRSAPAPTTPGQTWRATIEVVGLDGQVELDAASGAPLGARLQATYRFRRDGKLLTATVTHDESMGAAEPVVAPADSSALPERPRPMVDRQALLDDLAPSRRGRAQQRAGQ